MRGSVQRNVVLLLGTWPSMCFVVQQQYHFAELHHAVLTTVCILAHVVLGDSQVIGAETV